MRWQWRRKTMETPSESPLWVPPGRTRIPDGDTIRVGNYPLYVEMTHPGPEQHPLRQPTVALPVVRGPYLTLGALWRGAGWR